MGTLAATRAPDEARQVPFQVRGSLQTVLTLRLLVPDDPNFFPLLLDKIAHSPDFFRNAPLVLDVGPLAAREPLDMAALAEQLREHRLMPVGVQNGSPAWNEAATRAGLAVFGAGGSAQAPAEGPAGASGTVADATSSRAAPPRAARDRPARAGARRAAGHRRRRPRRPPPSVPERSSPPQAIHVYGILRGRAFAGIEGDEEALIFCDQLEAELLSIAGVHLVSEEIDPRHLRRRARVALEHERLVIHTLP